MSPMSLNHHQSRYSRLDRQMGGYLILELSAVLSVIAILAVFAAQQYVKILEQKQAEAAGAYGLTLKNALDAYITTQYYELGNDLPVTGVANAQSPTIEELKTAGHLPATFPVIDPLRKRYITEVRTTACPGQACDISALAFVNTPATRLCTAYAPDGSCATTSGSVNHNMVENFRMASKGYGAAVTLLDSSRFRGWVCDYPASAGAVLGTYGVCTSENAAIYARFVRIGDERDPSLRGDLTVDGHIAGQTLKPTGTASVGDSCTAEEAGAIRRGGNHNILLVCTGSVWVGLGDEINSYEASCSVEGKTAVTLTGQALVCRSGKYYYLTSLFGKYLLMDIRRGAEGTVISKPTCDAGGTPFITVLMKSETSSDGSFNRYADESSSNWTLRLRNTSGQVINGEVLAHIYCQYP